MQRHDWKTSSYGASGGLDIGGYSIPNDSVSSSRRLGMAEHAARRLLDLDCRSRIEAIEEALAALGKRLVVEIRDAA